MKRGCGDARREAQQHRRGTCWCRRSGAPDDLAARAAAVLGVVAGLEDLDVLDELLDDRRETVPNAGLVALAPSTTYFDSAPVVPARRTPAASRLAVGDRSTTAVKSRLVPPTGMFFGPRPS
jgi:hypothetical protein